MINIAMVEDEDSVVGELKTYLETYQRQKGLSFSVDSFKDGTSYFASFASKKYDVTLLDVDLPDSDNGMQIATKIRETDSEMQIAFITNIRQYALFGYEVNAFYYLLKPVSYAAFANLMDKGLEQLEKKKGNSLPLNTKDGLVLIKTSDIISITVDDHYLKIKTKKETVTLRDTLSHMEKTLENKGFAKPNNYQLINLTYVEKVDKDSLILSGETVQISRLKRKTLLDTLMKYYGEQL